MISTECTTITNGSDVEQITLTGSAANKPASRQCDHSMVEIDNNMYIYGGRNQITET